MKRHALLAGLCAALAFAAGACAQTNVIGGGMWGDGKPASASYQGPGDNAWLYWGTTGSC